MSKTTRSASTTLARGYRFLMSAIDLQCARETSENQARSGWRRAVAERRARSRLEPTAPSHQPPSEDHVEVARALAALPRREREVAVLRYLLGFDTAETAGVLGVGRGAGDVDPQPLVAGRGDVEC